MSFRRVDVRDSIVQIIYDDDRVAPRFQEANLERALQGLFPADTRAATFTVDFGWGEAESVWLLRRAVTTRGGVSANVTDSLRAFLGAAGIPIDAARAPGPPANSADRRGGVEPTRARAPSDARRTPRISRSVPLRLESERGTACDAKSAVINAHGALLLSPQALPDESRVRITNLERGRSEPFRVVWCGAPGSDLHQLGVEMLTSVDFWGPAYRIDAKA